MQVKFNKPLLRSNNKETMRALTTKKVITYNNIKVESDDFSTASRTQNTSHLGGGNIVAAKSRHCLNKYAPRRRLKGSCAARAYN